MTRKWMSTWNLINSLSLMKADHTVGKLNSSGNFWVKSFYGHLSFVEMKGGRVSHPDRLRREKLFRKWLCSLWRQHELHSYSGQVD